MNEIRANATIQTYEHVKAVRKNLTKFVKELVDRADHHDDTKFESPEVEIFGDNTHLLSSVEYGSPEYHALRASVKPATDHHYANNRHHPEHWPNGIEDMNLVDLVELICDWKAATARNKNGNIRKSIEINAQRYGISPQLRKILENTVREMFQD